MCARNDSRHPQGDLPGRAARRRHPGGRRDAQEGRYRGGRRARRGHVRRLPRRSIRCPGGDGGQLAGGRHRPGRLPAPGADTGCQPGLRPRRRRGPPPRPGHRRPGRPARHPGSRRLPRREGRHQLRPRADSAHHPRPEHGRAVVDGHGGRLQGRAARREHHAAHVPDADDRRRHHRAGARVRHRGRRRRPAGDRLGAAARRQGRGLRRPAGGQGTDPEPRRQVRRAAARDRPAPRTRAATPRRRTRRSTRSSAS